MKLLSVTVSGFRNLSRTTLRFPGIVAVVSPNNFGKSNLLDAIAFASDFISASPRKRDAMMGRADAIPLVTSLALEPYEFLVEFEDAEADREYRVVRYGFSLVWARDDGSGRRIVGETLQASPDGRRWTSFLRRDTGQYRKGKGTRSFRRVSLEPNQLAIDVLTAIDDIEINHTIKSIQSFSLAICSSLDASQRFDPLPVDFTWERLSDGDLVLDDSDLPRALYRLKTIAPGRFQDLLFAVHSLFPSFKSVSVDAYEVKQEIHDQLSATFAGDAEADIPLRIRDEMYKVTIRDENLNQPVDVSRMSTGTKRLIWLVTNVIIGGEIGAGCVAIEEVETSIHPRMLETLLEILGENLRGTSLILTSHSPYLVQYLRPESLYVGVPRDDGVAAFRRIRSSAVGKVLENARSRGMGHGDYLFDLMSGGDDGLAALSGYLEE